MKSLEELNWEQFHIGDVFSVERPVARNKDNYEHGDVPFVASGAANNGVLKCCRPKNDETLDKRNCITVSPVDGSTFYQVFDFLGRGGAGSSVLLLRSPQNELLSGQFVSRMISQTCSKYTYGHMGSKESVIQLPRRLRKTSGKNYSVNLMRHARKEPLMFLKLSTGLN